MATYRCGCHGPNVEAIQKKLCEDNCYSGRIDGDFGGGTESAVKTFQRKSGLQVDGTVGPATWEKLFGVGQQPSEPAIKSNTLDERCLALTGSFETNHAAPECFAGLSGDFDGEGMSLGVCQWNIGRGSLQPLLSEMNTNHPATIDSIFHDYATEFRRVLDAPRQEQLAWVRTIQDQRFVIHEPWRGLLGTMASTPEFQQIQRSHALRLFNEATTLCRDFQLSCERALALMFCRGANPT